MRKGNMSSLRSVTARMLDRIPPAAAAELDLRRPNLSGSWGGPMNGQRGRQGIVRQIFRSIPVEAVVETGTFRGTTSQFLADVSGVTVYTVEAHERYFRYATKRLVDRDIRVAHQDSRSFLRNLTQELGPESTVFFYLDAHWGEDLPLVEELEIIASNWPRSVIMVDDFEVPGDPGYGFDDYGPGKSLTEGLMRQISLAGWRLAYPALPSSGETGARRGAVILISPLLGVSLHELDSIRIAATLP